MAAPQDGAEPEDDEALARRALERLLEQRGALLLRAWTVEVVPELSYAHTDTLALGGEQLLARTRTNQIQGVLTLRLGLPWQLQLEGSVPGLRVGRDVSSGAARAAATAVGLGDTRVSLTHHLVHARNAIPDVLIAGSWRAPAGTSPYDVAPGEVPLGAGFHGLQAKLIATKVADPLVYLANASYEANLRADTNQGRIDPGDTWGVGGGAFLAVSPETSLSFLVQFQYTPELRLRAATTPGTYQKVPGTDQTVASLQLGLATLVSRHALLNFALEIGLTEDAPDFRLGVSVPLH
jgi:hypothetical protein